MSQSRRLRHRQLRRNRYRIERSKSSLMAESRRGMMVAVAIVSQSFSARYSISLGPSLMMVMLICSNAMSWLK